jgi:hypothetical protein
MKIVNSGKEILVYVQKDEPVMKSLTSVCEDLDIQNGQISGIGAVKEIELGTFDVKSKSYFKKHLSDVFELLSFQGNITLKENNPFIHAHITIGKHDLEVKGGHLFEMDVAVVGEFIIRKIDTNIFRQLDQNIGLPVWCTDN